MVIGISCEGRNDKIRWYASGRGELVSTSAKFVALTITAGGGPLKDLQDGGAPDLVEKILGHRSPDHPSRLNEGQPGAHDLRRAAQQTMHLVTAGFIEQPPKHGAAFRVERHRSARSASRSAWL